MRFCGQCGAALPEEPPPLPVAPPTTAPASRSAQASYRKNTSRARPKPARAGGRIARRYILAVAAAAACFIFSVVGAALFDINRYERASEPASGQQMNSSHTLSRPVAQPRHIPRASPIETHGCRRAAGAGLASLVCARQSVTLPAGAGEYFYVGATAGGAQMSGVSWSSDLSVIAAYSGNRSISIGHSHSNVGRYRSRVGNYAIGGVALSEYSTVNMCRASSNGTTLTLHCVVPAGTTREILVVGGEGTAISAVSAKAFFPLENVTYSESGGDVIASAGIFMGVLSPGEHTFTITSRTYPSNSGTALGAVLYVLKHASSS